MWHRHLIIVSLLSNSACLTGTAYVGQWETNYGGLFGFPQASARPANEGSWSFAIVDGTTDLPYARSGADLVAVAEMSPRENLSVALQHSMVSWTQGVAMYGPGMSIRYRSQPLETLSVSPSLSAGAALGKEGERTEESGEYWGRKRSITLWQLETRVLSTYSPWDWLDLSLSLGARLAGTHYGTDRCWTSEWNGTDPSKHPYEQCPEDGSNPPQNRLHWAVPMGVTIRVGGTVGAFASADWFVLRTRLAAWNESFNPRLRFMSGIVVEVD